MDSFSEKTALLQNRKLLFLANIVFWTFMGIMQIVNNISWSLTTRNNYNWKNALEWNFHYYLSSVLLSIIVYYTYIKIRKFNTVKQVTIFFLSAIISGFVEAYFHAVVQSVIKIITHVEALSFITTFNEFINFKFPYSVNGFMMYGLVLIILVGVDVYGKYKYEHIISAELRSQLAEAKLGMLKMQLQPHFLFNALNSITMMARQQQNDKVINMIINLSSMLRYTLQLEEKRKHPLKAELEILSKYLEIENERFRDKLAIQYNLDPESLGIEIPTLLLQPLVENALKHGVSKTMDGCLLEIGSKVVDKLVTIEIFNTGPLLPDHWNLFDNQGIGLKNTVNRLQQEYGDSYQFKIFNEEEKGVKVKISLPKNHD